MTDRVRPPRFYIRPFSSLSEADWIVTELQFLRAICVGGLLGLFGTVAVIKALEPLPGQAHRITIVWETVDPPPPTKAAPPATPSNATPSNATPSNATAPNAVATKGD